MRKVIALCALVLGLVLVQSLNAHHDPFHRKLRTVAKCPGTVAHIARTKRATWKVQDMLGQQRHIASARYPSSYISCRYARWVAVQWRARLKEARQQLSSVSTVEGAIRYVWGDQAAKALQVAWCESHLFVWARNGQYLGLFQMGVWARATYGHGSDALTQARAAYANYLANGWSQWECSPHGAFRD